MERWRPSKLNGVVTIATVRMPSALAVAATTGAAPLPVPPPMPACARAAPHDRPKRSARQSC